MILNDKFTQGFLESKDEKIQELKEKIHDLEQENTELKGKNKGLQDIVDIHSNIEKRRLESIENYNRMYGK